MDKKINLYYKEEKIEYLILHLFNKYQADIYLDFVNTYDNAEILILEKSELQQLNKSVEVIATLPISSSTIHEVLYDDSKEILMTKFISYFEESYEKYVNEIIEMIYETVIGKMPVVFVCLKNTTLDKENVIHKFIIMYNKITATFNELSVVEKNDLIESVMYTPKTYLYTYNFYNYLKLEKNKYVKI